MWKQIGTLECPASTKEEIVVGKKYYLRGFCPACVGWRVATGARDTRLSSWSRVQVNIGQVD